MKAVIKKVGEIMCVELEGTAHEVAQAVVLMDLDLSAKEAKEPTKDKPKRRMVRWDDDEASLRAQIEFTSEWCDFSEEDIERQIALASSWLFKHPSERGPRSNLDRFLRNWLNEELGTAQ